MTNINLKLDDEEFLQLGAIVWGSTAWCVTPGNESIKSLFDKIRIQVERKATPGQVKHLDRITAALNDVFGADTVDREMIRDGFNTLLEQATEKLQG